MTAYRLRLLGGAQLEAPTGPLGGRAAQRHQLALLAVLTTAPNHTLSRDKVLAYLWPEVDTERARHRLNVAVHQIRRALGEGAIVSVVDDLRCDPDIVGSDVTEFEAAVKAGALERAAAVYGGPFLDGFHLKGAHAFEEWVSRERARFARRYADALTQLAGDATAHGDGAGAVRWWRALVTHLPYRGRAALGLMEALAAAGDRAEALEAATAYTRRVRGEMGLEPEPEVVALAEELRVRVFSGGKRQKSEAVVQGRGPARVIPSVRWGARPRRGTRSVLWSAAIVAIVLAGAVGWLTLGDRLAADRPEMLPSIAVLPFENLSPVPESDAFFVDGLHDEIIARLAKVAGLRVISRTSVMQYRDRVKSVQQVAEELGVGAVLEATVRRSEGQLRITVQLLDPETDAVIWGELYDRPFAEIFAVQADLARHVTASLEAELTAREAVAIAAKRTGNPEAYELYLRASAQMRSGLDRGGLERRRIFDEAIRFLQAALALDPEFALAHARLGMQRTLNLWLLGDRTTGDRDRIRIAVDRALALEPDLPEARLARVWELYFAHRDFEGALDAAAPLQAIMGNDPDLLSILFVANRRLGRHDLALAHLHRLAMVDPLNSWWAREEAAVYLSQRRWKDVERVLDRAARLWPNRGWPHSQRADLAVRSRGDLVAANAALRAGLERGICCFIGDRFEIARLAREYDSALTILDELDESFFAEQDGRFPVQLQRGRINYHAGRVGLARAQFDTAGRRLDAMMKTGRVLTARGHHWLALADAGTGRTERALQEAGLAIELAPGHDQWMRPAGEYWLARISAMVGEAEQALDILERLIQAPITPVTKALLRLDPDWDPIRDHPRFRRLVAEAAGGS